MLVHLPPALVAGMTGPGSRVHHVYVSAGSALQTPARQRQVAAVVAVVAAQGEVAAVQEEGHLVPTRHWWELTLVSEVLVCHKQAHSSCFQGIAFAFAQLLHHRDVLIVDGVVGLMHGAAALYAAR